MRATDVQAKANESERIVKFSADKKEAVKNG